MKIKLREREREREREGSLCFSLVCCLCTVVLVCHGVIERLSSVIVAFPRYRLYYFANRKTSEITK